MQLSCDNERGQCGLNDSTTIKAFSMCEKGIDSSLS